MNAADSGVQTRQQETILFFQISKMSESNLSACFFSSIRVTISVQPKSSGPRVEWGQKAIRSENNPNHDSRA